MNVLAVTRQDTFLFHRSLKARRRKCNQHSFKKATEKLRLRVKQPPFCQKDNLCQYYGWFLLLCLSGLKHLDDFNETKTRHQHKLFHVTSKADICLIRS